jgi:hypothetical protein
MIRRFTIEIEYNVGVHPLAQGSELLLDVTSQEQGVSKLHRVSSF